MLKTIKTTLIAGAACLATAGPAQAILVTPTDFVGSLTAALLAGGGSGIDTASLVATLAGQSSGDAISSGTYTNAAGTYGIGGGVVLSSGSVSNYNTGPNSSSGTSTSYGPAATAAQEAILDPITNDANGPYNHFDVTEFVLTFDMLPGFTDVFFNVVFGSEEFPEFVGSFNDGFGLLVNGVNIASVAGLPVNINHPDMALVPGTELDGVLGGSTSAFGPLVHEFSSAVNPTGNELRFIISDTADTNLDTTVYISQLGGTPPPIDVPAPAPLALIGMGLLALRLRRAA